jgi:epoxyqueuosine reductase
MPAAADAKSLIRAEALAQGFDAVGFAAAVETERAKAGLREFLAAGMQGDMGWLAADPERRADPKRLWPEARSVVVLGLSYAASDDPLALLARPERGNLSIYARGRDYHDVIKPRLKTVARAMAAKLGAAVKVFVDTAPVLEKPLAEAGGIGWQGKHTNLVSRQHGSWLFLGEIFTDLALKPDAAEADHCGICHACLDICPTAAFPAPYQLDARRCISYLTIEHKGHIAREFRVGIGNRIYGCDDCQLVCPWNRFAQKTVEPDFAVRNGLDDVALTELLAWDEVTFHTKLAGSAIHRIGHEQWLRNIAVALGNAPSTPEVVTALQTRSQHPSTLVREHVEWALQRHSKE